MRGPGPESLHTASTTTATSAPAIELADLSDELLAIVSADGALVASGGAWRRVLGRRASDLTPSRFRSLVHPDDRATFDAAWRRVIEGDAVGEIVLRIAGVDGHRREVTWSAARRQDGTIGVRGRDDTERRRAELDLERQIARLESANADLEQFTATVSHDLREPLRVVTGYIDLLSRRCADDLDETGRAFLRHASDGAERMRALIEDLLAYARVGADGTCHEPVDLGALLDAVREDLGAALEESGGVVEARDLPTVVGDATQLRQLLQNLIGNALKFRSGDGPRVVVSGHEDDEGWSITVADDGIGIPAEQHERIFEVFGRAHGGDAYPGSGIGLSICRRVAERHGGRIELTSTPGEGSVFTVRLPRRGRGTCRACDD